MDYLLSEFYRQYNGVYTTRGVSFLQASILQRSHSQLILEVYIHLVYPTDPGWDHTIKSYYYFAGNKLYYHGEAEEIYEVTPWERLKFTLEGTKEISCFDRDIILEALDADDRKILTTVWKYGRKGGGILTQPNLMFDADDIVVHCLYVGISNNQEEPFAMICGVKINPEDKELFKPCFDLKPHVYTAIGRESLRSQWVCDEYRFLEVLRSHPYTKTATKIYYEMAKRAQEKGSVRSWSAGAGSGASES